MLKDNRAPILSPFHTTPPFTRAARGDKIDTPKDYLTTVEAIILLRTVLYVDLKTAKDLMANNFGDDDGFISVVDMTYLIACLVDTNDYPINHGRMNRSA